MCQVKGPDYLSYIQKLSETTNHQISTFQDLLTVAEQRIDDFHAVGCRLSDHGLAYLPDVNPDDKGSAQTFNKVLSGNEVSLQDAEIFMVTMLHHLCQCYQERGWAQQFHLGAIRNNNTRLTKKLGADIGVDSMGDYAQIQGLARFLDHLNMKEKLAKTILYNNNPIDNAAFATMIANFNEHPTPGKMQFGASWWFLDQYQGIVSQLKDLANYGLLSRFVGMLTDSRSFLSFPRHEYFRRVLCEELGKELGAGHLPNDLNLIGSMVQNICYHNAKNYFGFE
jgi:glucuronate isomerase